MGDPRIVLCVFGIAFHIWRSFCLQFVWVPFVSETIPKTRSSWRATGRLAQLCCRAIGRSSSILISTLHLQQHVGNSIVILIYGCSVAGLIEANHSTRCSLDWFGEPAVRLVLSLELRPQVFYFAFALLTCFLICFLDLLSYFAFFFPEFIFLYCLPSLLS